MLLLTGLVTLSLPLLIVIALLATALPQSRGALPTLGFITGYLWCETLGLVSFAWLAMRHRNRTSQPFIKAVYRVQFWWVLALRNLAQFFFRLEFFEHNTAALQGPAALFLPRHASIADTIIPIAFYGAPYKLTLRYVLKQELLWDPCLDIAGNWLPNYFVDRSGENSQAAIDGVGQMVSDLSADEGMMIFLEGTRFTPEKHASLKARCQPGSALEQQLNRWPDLLPPRLGGASALLANNAQHDILFCAHQGFENSSSFGSLLNGSWWQAKINIAYWRIPYHDIPTEPKEQQQFLFTQWDKMQDTVNQFT